MPKHVHLIYSGMLKKEVLLSQDYKNFTKVQYVIILGTTTA